MAAEDMVRPVPDLEKIWLDGRWVILVSEAAALMVQQEAGMQGEQQ